MPVSQPASEIGFIIEPRNGILVCIRTIHFMLDEVENVGPLLPPGDHLLNERDRYKIAHSKIKSTISRLA